MSLLILLLWLLFFFLLGRPLQKSLRLRRFKLDQDEIWQECSSSKYAPIHQVGFSIWVTLSDGSHDVISCIKVLPPGESTGTILRHLGSRAAEEDLVWEYCHYFLCLFKWHFHWSHSWVKQESPLSSQIKIVWRYTDFSLVEWKIIREFEPGEQPANPVLLGKCLLKWNVQCTYSCDEITKL